MTHARPLEAMEQGHLDSLCGLYSAVNAIRWVLGGDPPGLSAVDLFEIFVEHLGHVRATDALIAGIEPNKLWRVLRAVLADLRRDLGVVIAADRPFAGKRKPTVGDVREAFAADLGATGVAYVVVFRGRLNHWSVVRRATASSLLLFDSCGRTRIPISHCRMTGEAEGRDDCPHVLERRGIIRLVVRAED